jgi:hypothetical protein
MTVRLHIDRLIVDGVALTPAEARALRGGVESHLEALFGESRMRATASHAVDALAAPDMKWDRRAGSGIARSLHTVIAGNRSNPRGGR